MDSSEIPPELREAPPNSTPVTTPFKLPIQEPDNNKNKLILIILAVVVLLGGGVLTAYFVLTASQPTVNTAASPSSEPVGQSTKIKNAEAVVTAIRSILKSTVVETTFDKEKGFAMTAENVVISAHPTRQLPGNDFATWPATSYTISVSEPADKRLSIDNDYSAAIDFLEKNDFTLQKNEPTEADYEDGQKTSSYISDLINCNVYRLYYPDPKGNHYTSVSCADTQSYKKQAVITKPFYDIFIAKYPEYLEQVEDNTNPLLVTNPVIKNGLDKYKNAQVGFSKSGIIVYFYQKPGGEWQYHTASSSILPVTCESFNTPEIKKAFAGISCYGTSSDTDSTVKP